MKTARTPIALALLTLLAASAALAEGPAAKVPLGLDDLFRVRVAREVRVSPDLRHATAFVLPRGGIEAWDRPGEPLHDPQGLAGFCTELRARIAPPVRLVEIGAHINDAGFSDTVLEIFDDWVARGRIAPGQRLS